MKAQKKEPRSNKSASAAVRKKSNGKVVPHVYLWLVAIYLFMTLLHTLLAYATVLYPSVMIDEMLYANLARSIANGEGLLFMGQPADYTFIFYPLVLAPVYTLFPEGANFYKIIQCFNAALMSLSAFPIFALAKAVTRNERRALGIAFLSLLLPDFLLSGYMLSESVIYPMFFTIFYLAYRYMENPKAWRAALIGLLGGLLFETKPGHVAPAALALGLCLLYALRRREKKYALHFLCGAASFAAVVAAFYCLLRFVFKQQVSLFSIYEEQVVYNGSLSAAELGAQIEGLLKGMILSPYFIFLACGGLCLVLPILLYRQYDANGRTLFALTMLSLCVTILGTAWTINRYEHSLFLVHLRYYAPYIPLLLVLSMTEPQAPAVAGKRRKIGQSAAKESVPAILLVAGVCLCSLFWGCKSGFHANVSPIAGLSASTLRYLPDNLAFSASLVIAALSVGMYLFVRKRQYVRLQKAALLMLTICFLVNNSAFLANKNDNSLVVSGSNEAMQVLGEQDCVFVIRNRTLSNYTLLDANRKKTSHVININDLFNDLSINHGVYRSHVPEQYRGMAAVTATPEVEYLAIDNIAYEYVKFASAAQVLTDESHAVIVVRIPHGERCASSVMGGVLDYDCPVPRWDISGCSSPWGRARNWNWTSAWKRPAS